MGIRICQLLCACLLHPPPSKIRQASASPESFCFRIVRNFTFIDEVGLSRIIFLLHRYFGIGLGLVVTLWCLSGFVMMYVPFPAVDEQEQLQSLPELDLTDCCLVPGLDDFSEIEISSARVAMWPSGPTLFLEGDFGFQYPINLSNGEYIFEISQEMADAQALQYSQQMGSGSELEYLGLLESDQWTSTGYFDAVRPFYLYEALDGRGSLIYVSSVSGQVVQDSTRMERGWNWVGAVVHWLYPSILRSNTKVWYWTVVVLTVLSLFLTLTGIYIGIRYFRFKAKTGNKSPFRGWGMWHHYIGLIFGLLTLTWLFSGLLSMEPFSVLQARNTAVERSVVQGGVMSFDSEIRQSLSQLSRAGLDDQVVQIEFEKIDGNLVALVTDTEGARLRYNPQNWQPQPLSPRYFSDMAARMRPGVEIASQEWIDQYDAYYYSRRTNPTLPVYRVIYADGERAYFEPVSGELRYFIDRARQWNRWLFNGLHSLDFPAIVHNRPLWDILVWLLLGGVTAGAISGTWLGWKRLTKS